MKPNFGITPIPTLCSNQKGLVASRNLWFHTKFLGCALGLGLVLFGNVVVQLPYTSVLAATACTFMRSGSDGDSVRALQKTLNDNGFGAGAVDGNFGQQTEIAVILFQRAKGLDVDGEVGPATCAALIALDRTEFVATVSPTPTEPSTPPAVPGSASSDDTLARNDRGLEVTLLQNTLRSLGYPNVQATGVYDEFTEDAVRSFQFTEGLPVTGEADPITRARLASSLNSANSGGTPTPQPTPAPPNVDLRPPVTGNSGNNNNELDYQVVVPIRDNDNILATAQTVVSSAVLNRTRLGTFVNAGSYANRDQAESVSYALRAKGLDARVVRR